MIRLMLSLALWLAAVTPFQLRAESTQIQIEYMTGAVAETLLALNPAEPVMILDTDRGGTRVILIAATEDEVPNLLRELIVSASPPYCDEIGPVACCEPQLGEMLIRTAQGWLRYGETCSIPQDAPPQPDSGQIADVTAVELDSQVEAEITKRFGNIRENLVLPKANGRIRLLVPRRHATEGKLIPIPGFVQDSRDFSLYSENILLATLGPWPRSATFEPPSITLASSHCHSINECNQNGPDSRCNRGNRRIYTRQNQAWCRTGIPCTCRY